MFSEKHRAALAQRLKRKDGATNQSVSENGVKKLKTKSWVEEKNSSIKSKSGGKDVRPTNGVTLDLAKGRLKQRVKASNQLSLNEKSQKLREESTSRLAFSQFRSINEYLYSNSSSKVAGYMDADTFHAYHSAYSTLASKWPVKPIDTIITMMSKYYTNHGQGQTFADMGCGDKPMIAAAFPNAKVYSFDLYSNNEKITKSCVTSVPMIADSSVHCVVYSLSLMNTNVVDVIKEGTRILKNSGHLIIAEVASRFQPSKVNVTHGKDGEEQEGDKLGVPDSVQSFGRKLEKYFNLKLKRMEYLKPNDYFVVFDFVKVLPKANPAADVESGAIDKKNKKNRTKPDSNFVPEIKLNPCLYKPR